ncbi:MAG: GNAT family N-acetyltransferase [Clostridia bacterium]|nr:GNAT family N-acetyltransferase [Clostridia bacterium]
MALEFRKLNEEDIDEITAYKQEFIDCNSGMDGTGVLCECDAREWLLTNRVMETTTNPQYIRYLQYGLFSDGRLLGLLQIRLELKGYLINFGGHIGYCVRPSERRRGYAKAMLKAALDICRDVGLDKVLITCLEDNVGSARTIESCGGVFEKTVYDDVNYKANMKRYWITL